MSNESSRLKRWKTNWFENFKMRWLLHNRLAMKMKRGTISPDRRKRLNDVADRLANNAMDEQARQITAFPVIPGFGNCKFIG